MFNKLPPNIPNVMSLVWATKTRSPSGIHRRKAAVAARFPPKADGDSAGIRHVPGGSFGRIVGGGFSSNTPTAFDSGRF